MLSYTILGQEGVYSMIWGVDDSERAIWRRCLVGWLAEIISLLCVILYLICPKYIQLPMIPFAINQSLSSSLPYATKGPPNERGFDACAVIRLLLLCTE
jgi:hypothetical protein